jgi:Toprim domain
MTYANYQSQYNTPTSVTQGASVGDVITRIANHCGLLEVKGLEHKCKCPICGGKSFSVRPGFKQAIIFSCWRCESNGLNNGYTEQREYLIEKGLLDPSYKQYQRMTMAERLAYEAKKRAVGQTIWDDSGPITPDSSVGRYLTGRGLGRFIGHPSLRRHKFFGATLVTRVWHAEHGFNGVQVTPIELWGDPPCRDKSEGRKTHALLKGAGAWFNAPKEDEWMVVAEGLETLLSAMIIFDVRCGCAVLGPNLAGLVLPKTARRIIIAADNDQTGNGASYHAKVVFRSRGLQVRVAIPDMISGMTKTDFNDVLMAMLSEAPQTVSQGQGSGGENV